MGINQNYKWPKKPKIILSKNNEIYISVSFTWQLKEVENLYLRTLFSKDKQFIIGGPATQLIPNYFKKYNNVKVKKHFDGALQLINPMATKTTMGCINKCKFCAVPKIEGRFKTIKTWPNLPIVCDNNLLAAPKNHFNRVLDRLVSKWKWADFNQGLDFRLLTDFHIKRLAELKNKKTIIRLALDGLDHGDLYKKKYDLLIKKIPKSMIRTYALIGFNTGPKEAWERCKYIESLGSIVLPMWFNSLNSLIKDEISKHQKEMGWNEFEKKRIIKFYYWHTDIIKMKKWRPYILKGIKIWEIKPYKEK